MRIKNPLSVSLIICLFFFACFALSCSKKEPEPPKPPQVKVELPPPKPPEPPKQYTQEVKEAPKLKETGKKTPRKKTQTQKSKAPVTPPALPQIVNLDRLNIDFKTNHLNVWASEWNSDRILLNGYVKSEREREDALSLARRYNPNITDMINTVTVYDTSKSPASRRRQSYPFSNSK